MATHTSRTWISVGIIVIAIILVIVFVPKTKEQSQTDEVATTTPPTLEQKMVVTSKIIKDENSKAGYSINVIYPQLSGLTRSDAQIKINKSISTNINELISDFKKSNNDVSDSLPGSGLSTLDVTYSIQPNTTIPNLISIRLIESFFESGAAHPGHFIETLNYNTSTGMEVTLDDVFSSSDYLQRISSYTRAELQKKIGSDENIYPQITSGTTPDKENFSSFMFADTGLIIIFQEYQVAAYAAGVQEVFVHYSAIRDIIDQNGPLSFLFR
ncbi:MAG: DUF3298 domain-containing protein [Patescibacteria group bacterium]